MENNSEKSQTKIIASTNVFQIEFVEKLGKEDYPPLINISLHLAKEYGRQAVLTKNTIDSFGKGGFFFKHEEDLRKFLKENVTAKDVILIKGSRGMQLEDVLKNR